MDIVFLLIILWRKKYLIFGVAAISIGVAFLATRNLEDKFRSRSQITTGFITNEGIKVTDERFNIREADLKFANLLSTMKSGVVYNLVSYRLALHDLDPSIVPFRNIPNDVSTPIPKAELDSAKIIFQEQLENMRPLTIAQENSQLLLKVLRGFGYTYPWLSNSLIISRVPNTDYIQIELISENRELSAFAVNAYFEEFMRYYAGQRAASSGESVEFFEELVIQKKTELDQKNDALQKFKTESNYLGISDQGDKSVVLDLENQRTEINSKIYGLRLKLDYLKEGLSGNSGTATPAISQNNEKVIQLRRSINELNSRPQTAATIDSLSVLRQQLSFELSLGNDSQSGNNLDQVDLQNQIKNTEIEIAIENSKLGQVNTKLRNLQGVLTTYVSKEAALSALETEVTVASTEYIDAVNRYNEARNVLLAATSTIKQVAKAAPAPTPLPNNRLIIIAFSGLLSFSLCVFVIVIIEILEGSIKTANQFENAVDMDVLGTLVKINTKNVDFDNMFSSEQKDKNNELFKHFLRKIRYEVESSGGKTFLITSTKRNQGKSFLTFSLAFVLSRVKKKVLIIDTNFKSNELTRTLQAGYRGREVMKKEAPLKGIEVISLRNEEDRSHLKPVIHQTKYENIFIIGNQGGQESPEEVLPAEEFKSLIKVLENKFDYILMEGPALNEYADAKELIQYVDKIIAVFAAGTTIKQLDRVSIEYLMNIDGKLLGGVLNQMDSRNLNL